MGWTHLLRRRIKPLLAPLAASLVVGGLFAAAGPIVPSLAQEQGPARPANLHEGRCGELGQVVAPLQDLTAPSGEKRGSAGAEVAQHSLTHVPLPLDTLLDGEYAINVHRSAEAMESSIACGEIGGPVDASGALTIGLKPQGNTRFAGIAILAPGGDDASTDVTVYVIGFATGRERRPEPATPVATSDAAALATPAATASGAGTTPEPCDERPGVLSKGREHLDKATITPDQAIATARATLSGAMGSVELENHKGSLVYEVTIGDRELFVDANSGEIVDQRRVAKQQRADAC